MNNAMCVVIVTLAGTLIAGCGQPANPKGDGAGENAANITQSLADARTEYRAEWETFRREAAKNIANSEKELKSLRQKMAHDGSRLNAQYDNEVTLLEQKNRELKKTLDEYNARGQSEWEVFKKRVQHDMDVVDTAMTEVSRKIQ